MGFIFGVFTLFILSDVSEINSLEHKSVSTSVVRMEELLQTEGIMVDILSKFADEFEHKLKTIRNGILEMRVELEKSKSNEETYLSNPLNAFSLVRRMHTVWHSWKRYIEEPIGTDYINEIVTKYPELPTDYELREAIHSMDRIQSTYDLNPSDFLNGCLDGRIYDARLSSMDLYFIGSELFKENNFFKAENYLRAALHAYENSSTDTILGFTKQKIDDLLAKIDFERDENVQNESILQTFEVGALQQAWIDEGLPYEAKLIEAHELYKMGCKNQFPSRPYNLNCRYQTFANDFLKLAPFKMEEIALEPYMVLYYDVISDYEIEHLKNFSRELLERAKVTDIEGYDDLSDYRTSQAYWLEENESYITRIINKRIEDMTDLNVENSESLHIINYGIGGYYYLHTDDLYDANDDSAVYDEDRVSTTLFYLSDVEQGGATVFPFIKVAIQPKKGTALMWYNLDTNGKRIFNSRHAGCPVIVGSKWLLTKWVSKLNQFIKRPCLKEYYVKNRAV